MPDYIATGSSFVPDDPGRSGVSAGWQQDQWNFVSTTAGVGALTAWSNLGAPLSDPGGGVTIAVLDSGIAYRSRGKHFARSPDLAKSTFVSGRDFVDGDRLPLDENGHGTFVASTIAEQTDNGLGETGLAYGAKLMPVRVLDAHNMGKASTIAKGIRWAAKHGADVINLSLNFGANVTSCSQIPTVCGAIRKAIRKHGALVVAAAGNNGGGAPEMPAAANRMVLSVSSSTDQACLASSSNLGASITAPGGGACSPGGAGAAIWQYSMKPSAAASGDYTRFGWVGMSGTSQAAAETSAAAALVISSGVLGSNASPKSVGRRLRHCARAAGAGFGAGLLDAGRATGAASCSS